jgi:hypothetical protein
VFVYDYNPVHHAWLLTGTIKSPLASGPNRTVNQGFGYRVDSSGAFLIASTSINNGTIHLSTDAYCTYSYTELTRVTCAPPQPTSSKK